MGAEAANAGTPDEAANTIPKPRARQDRTRVACFLICASFGLLSAHTSRAGNRLNKAHEREVDHPERWHRESEVHALVVMSCHVDDPRISLCAPACLKVPNGPFCLLSQSGTGSPKRGQGSNGLSDDFTEQPRRHFYRQLVASGALPAGYASEDGVGLHYVGTEPRQAVTIRPGSKAWWVEADGSGGHQEGPLTPRQI